MYFLEKHWTRRMNFSNLLSFGLGRLMAKRYKPSPEQQERDRQSRWTLLKRNGYCGFRKCFRCPAITFCVGKTYERQACRDCFK